MKRLVLTIAIVLASLVGAKAQIWIGGSLDASLNKEAKTFSITPDVGYSIPNTPISVACAFNYEGSLLNDGSYSHDLTVSPYIRYLICEIGERFSLFVDLLGDFDVLQRATFDAGLSPGIDIALTEHWSAEFYFGFVGYQWKQVEDKSYERTFDMGLRTSASAFSIYYNF